MPLKLPPPRVRPWLRDKAEVVGRYRVFNVVASQMRSPDGAPVPHPMYTFDCPDWVNVLALTDDGHALFVWQYRHGTHALSLEIPGGVVDPGEAPLATAKRELREETGYEASQWETLVTSHPNPALHGNTQHTFLARGARLAGLTHFDPTEECELALVPVSDLAAIVDEGHATHSLTLLAIERFLRLGK